MLLRGSSLLMVVISIAFLSQYDCTTVKGIVDKIVPKSVQCLFRGKESYERENCNKNVNIQAFSNQEQGSLASAGRDLIKRISKTFGSGEENEIKVSAETDGLDCNKTFSSGEIDNFKSKVSAIYPGTKWCGDGNVARSFDDLGRFSDTDSCCREHDKCPTNIAADKTDFGLVNTGLFTRSHCDCDRKFYECLKEAQSLVSKSIGFTYFTVLGPQCFKQDYPITGCVRKEKGKCIEYKQDLQREQIYQWFDSPTF